mgnify:FL=1
MAEGQPIIHERGNTVNLTEAENRKKFYKKVLDQIDAQKKGSGLTKMELVRIHNLENPSTAEKWMRQCPELRKRCVYIHTNGGRCRTAIFVPLKYKAELIKNGTVTERY